MALLQINIYKMKKKLKGCAFQRKFKNYAPGDGKSTGERSRRVAFSYRKLELTAKEFQLFLANSIIPFRI